MVADKNSLDKKQVLSVLKQFLTYFQDAFHHATPPNPALFEKVLAQDFTITSNADVIAKDLPAYLKRIQKLQKHFKRVEIIGPLEEPVFAENKIVIIYDLSLTPHNGPKTEKRVIAIITIDGNKFTKWEDVLHTKGEDWV